MKSLLKGLQNELKEKKLKFSYEIEENKLIIHNLTAKHHCVEKEFRIVNNKFFNLRKESTHMLKVKDQEMAETKTKSTEDFEKMEKK
jgi:hypothetical protein